MSDSKKEIDEFTQLLKSVEPALPKGSPLQIMYLAGQAAANREATPNSSVRLWQFTTLVSTAIAAMLLVMILGAQTPEAVQPSNVVSREPLQPGIQAPAERDQPEINLTRFPRRRFGVADQFASSRLPKSSVDLFDGFEIQPVSLRRFGREQLR